MSREIIFKRHYFNSKGEKINEIEWGVFEGEFRSPAYVSLARKTIDYQYSGINDSKGIKIFEGDNLFVCSGYASRVEFLNGCFMSVYTHPEDGEIIPLCDVICDETTVVQNNGRG